ncbi:NAD(P)/FAD-dependent oxidoreductase [Streptomyces scabiei]|uniref:L-2-hydroxyglutarate oxidase LhgO n=1 Tax=Streptomyces scabiei TaxID=1930 RepID=A0A100JW25_STRSC|nr:NAD(P)/FAD-dependent oxidoreductase [Streptomyces scabiei]GAQ66748.1 L-2-hydroxyglutarate oxidase LhgO [Streptomyces scabiei]
MTLTSRQSQFDVLIVGGGDVGAAIARTLGRHPLRVGLVEASSDIGDGTSKANTAILHTGFDATPGTLESELVAKGYHLLRDYAAAAGIPMEPLGALLVAWDREQLDALPGLAEKAARNGYTETRHVDRDELYRREPHLGPGALGALEIPGESIICPWTTPFAFAVEALGYGVEILLDTEVRGVRPEPDGSTLVETGQGALRTRYLVNAAGLRSDEIDRMLGHEDFTVTPRRGELIVFDKFARSLVHHILLPVPTALGKGVLISPTVFGNVMLGPTAEDLGDKTRTASSPEGIDTLLAKGRRLMPDLLEEEVTTVYAGLRAATEHGDYQLRLHADQRYVCVGGIRSTGLTSALAIGEHVRDLLGKAGLELGEPVPARIPHMPTIGEASLRPYQRPDLIAEDPEYGTMVCHCERVSRGEIRDALASPLPARTLEGLRRRTRATLGRCQGFYCGAEVRHLLAKSAPAGEGR